MRQTENSIPRLRRAYDLWDQVSCEQRQRMLEITGVADRATNTLPEFVRFLENMSKKSWNELPEKIKLRIGDIEFQFIKDADEYYERHEMYPR